MTNTSYRKPPPSATPTNAFRQDLAAYARTVSVDQLRADHEIALTNLEDPLDPVEAIGDTARVETFERELDRRVRIFAVPGSRAATAAKDADAWDALRSSVKGRVSIVEVLDLLGFAPRMIGRELHGGCPICLTGDDRLLVRDDPGGGRCWCRFCGLRTDVIGLVRSCIPSASGYRDALTWLDDFAVTSGGGR